VCNAYLDPSFGVAADTSRTQRRTSIYASGPLKAFPI